MRRRLRLVAAPDNPAVQQTLELAERAGFTVTVDEAGYRLTAGPFDTADQLRGQLVQARFCLECGRATEQLCAACLLANVDGAADGDRPVGEVRPLDPSAAPGRPTLEVIR